MEPALRDIGVYLGDKIKAEFLSVALFETYEAIHRAGLLVQIFRLINHQRPMYFISESSDIAQAYVNALALLFDEQTTLESLLAQHNRPWLSEPNQLQDDSSLLEFWQPDQYIGRRFYGVDMAKLLSIYDQDLLLWTNILSYLNNEEFNKDHFLVIDNLHQLYKNGYGQQAYNLFTHSRNGLTFIAPMTWNDYASYIESGPRFLIHYITPILFSPRPTHIPPCPHIGIEPDRRFRFDKPNRG